MLILARRVGGSLAVGDGVIIMVLVAKGNQVRIGFRAPKEVAAYREEILRRVEGSAVAEDAST